jgi:hypothetical protein
MLGTRKEALTSCQEEERELAACASRPSFISCITPVNGIEK